METSGCSTFAKTQRRNVTTTDSAASLTTN